MPDVQAKRLVEMMDYVPPSLYLEASLLPIESKKSFFKALSIEDIIVLPMDKMEVMIHDSEGSVFGYGLYGHYNDTPSILVESISSKPAKRNDSKKYENMRISMGKIMRRELAEGKITPLHRDTNHDAILYKGSKVKAFASLAQVGQKIALHIREVH